METIFIKLSIILLDSQAYVHDHEQFVGCSHPLSLAEVVQNHRLVVSYWEEGLTHDTPNDGEVSCLLKDIICMQ